MNNWDSLSGDARVWLYGGNRALTKNEQQEIADLLNAFCNSWAAHGTKLKAGYKILYNQLIVLAVDEKSAAASGCSIDSSVQVFRDIDTNYNLDLFNRLRNYCVTGEGLSAYTAHEIKEHLDHQMIDANSLFVDVLVQTKEQVENELTKPMSETWLNKYLPKSTV